MARRLPTPATVRFQTSQRGVRFKTLKAAREDFLAWLDTGKSPAGARTEVHIWQNDRERTVTKIDQSERGEILRGVLRRALRHGTLQIRPRRAH